jgi:diguanylate cyclase (GGDEF)-like protein
MRSTAIASERPPRLALRFAVYTAVTLGLAAAGLLWFFYGFTRERAEQNVAFHTAFIADTIVRDRLTPLDFARPVSPGRAALLDALFRRGVLVEGYRRVKLYSPGGLVTYSNDRSLIGTRPDGDEVRKALHGEPATDVSHLNAEGGRGPNLQVLESYAPVDFGHGPVGAFELYQDYGPIAAAARATFLPIAVALGLALAVLYAALLPVLRAVVRRLERQLAEIEHRGLHDALTGLPNRALFRWSVARALERVAGGQAAVLVMDLDRFSEINDSLGHGSGDLVLQQAGRRLRDAVPADCLVARLDGDEFAVLAVGQAAANAPSFAQRLREELAGPFEVGDLQIETGVAVGIALHPAHGADADTLLQRADVAMYLAKRLRTGIEIYATDRDDHSPERLRLVGELRRAIETGQIRVDFQPEAALKDGRVRSAEALVRWEHPALGVLSPDVFVPLAEHTGLIRPLTRYVLDEALRELATWRAQGLELAVAVNVTARDLLDLDFPNEVRASLERFGVEPEWLELEITENTVLTDPAKAHEVLVGLDALGVRLAIDDFGSGNSPLRYLRGLPVDVLKIDRAFVTSMETNEKDAAIVRSAIELGHNLGLEVVAEGVESEGTWRDLETLGCDTAQGYFLGRPVRGSELAARLRGRESRAA